MSTADRPALGIALRLLSGLLMAGMFVCAKAVSGTVPLGEIVFFRSAFAILPLVAFLWLRGEFPGGLATKRPFDHLLRASLGALALFPSFEAVARLPLAEAILVAQLSPDFLVIGGVLLLSERPTIWRIGGTALGLAGVVVLVGPALGGGGGEGRLGGYAVGLAAAALTAGALVMVRRLNRTESPGAIALYFVLASMTASLLTLPLGWTLPTGGTLALLIGAGLFGLPPSSALLLAAPLVLAGAALAAMERRR